MSGHRGGKSTRDYGDDSQVDVVVEEPRGLHLREKPINKER